MSIILGYSGIDGALDYQRKLLPGLSEREYRMHQGADSAAALLVNGEIVAAVAQERFSGEKHTGSFPLDAIEYCLAETGLKIDDVDFIAHSFDYGSAPGIREISAYHRNLYDDILSPKKQIELIGINLGERHKIKYRPVNHHLSHAASTFYTSGFESALVCVSDGLGESDSSTIYTADKNGIKALDAISGVHSIGIFYGIITHYLGFSFNSDEYKVMGLAPYGDPNRFIGVFEEEFIRFLDSGRYALPPMTKNIEGVSQAYYSGTLKYLEDRLGPSRQPGGELTKDHRDIAAAMQQLLTSATLHRLKYYQSVTGAADLCLSGGVALNCTTNSAIARSGYFDRIHVFPAAGDDGAAVGAALVMANKVGNIASRALDMPYWGETVSGTTAEVAAIRMDGVEFHRIQDDQELFHEVAQCLARGMIIGWAHGRMEFGPRALGNRSILADPRKLEMKDEINRRIKQREAFRPFAPIVLEESAGHWFELPVTNWAAHAWMTVNAQARPGVKDIVPSVVHEDDSARLQLVRKTSSPRLWGIISAFERLTSVPILLNTSFNINGQPIVRNEQEALSTLISANLDLVVIDDLIIRPAL